MPRHALPQRLRRPQRDTKAPLEEQQQAFCREFVRCPNGTLAAIRAGYSPASARVQGSRLLSQARVRDEIERLLKYQGERPAPTKARVSEELEALAFAQLTDYVEWDSTGVRAYPSKDVPPAARAALKMVRHRVRERVGRDGVIERRVEVEVEIADKHRALDSLARLYGYVSASNQRPGEGNGRPHVPAIWLPQTRPA